MLTEKKFIEKWNKINTIIPQMVINQIPCEVWSRNIIIEEDLDRQVLVTNNGNYTARELIDLYKDNKLKAYKLVEYI